MEVALSIWRLVKNGSFTNGHNKHIKIIKIIKNEKNTICFITDPRFIKAQQISDSISLDSLTYNKFTIGAGKSGVSYNGLTLWSDSTISIEGDTTKAIRLMFLELQKFIELYYASESILDRLNLDIVRKTIFNYEKNFSLSLKYYRDTKKKFKVQ